MLKGWNQIAYGCDWIAYACIRIAYSFMLVGYVCVSLLATVVIHYCKASLKPCSSHPQNISNTSIALAVKGYNTTKSDDNLPSIL